MQIYFIPGRINFHYFLSNTTQVASELVNFGSWGVFFVVFLVGFFLWTNKWHEFSIESLLLSSSHWAWLDIFFICLEGPNIIRQEAISLSKIQNGNLPSEESNNLLNTTYLFSPGPCQKKTHYWFLLDWEGSLKSGFWWKISASVI